MSASTLVTHRSLCPYDPRAVASHTFDLVVVGGGAAGGLAALEAASAGLSVALLAKAEAREGNTRYAQGGVAAVLSPEDSVEDHIADTLRVGRELCEGAIVREVISSGPAVFQHLLDLGAQFDRDSNGDLSLSREGGHSSPRVAHARGDATGAEIQHTLHRALSQHPNISVFPHQQAVDVLFDAEGCAAGVLTLDPSSEALAFSAGQVLLATGGSGHIWRETTNPTIATGDGVAMAWRAGATLQDLEFVQFHPTCLYVAGAARVLISEIVRGAGAVLRDRHGERFMAEFHPDAELAPRDVVSRAVFTRMVETEDTSCYLDLAEVNGDPHALFPGISRFCRAFGIDIAKEPIPVRPGAHYQIGGVRVDLAGRTDVPGLWAVGEVASSGLHGANRMGSNSLLEGLVLGVRAGRELAAAGRASAGRAGSRLTSRADMTAPAPSNAPSVSLNLQDITYSMKSLMWRHMGVQRSGAGLAEAKEKLAFWAQVVQDLSPKEARSFELLNMLTVAHLATTSALAREESRGVHYRDDFPEQLDGWRRHTLLCAQFEGERAVGLEPSHEPIGQVGVPTS
ncbi:MAG: L-aspartate oxidase [Planctomycetes bacterium]|nr:L-aspartate oxidase [Planctomycetota bacterium]